MASGTSLVFGPYDILSAAPTDTLGTIQVICARNGGPKKLTVSMQLGEGLNGRSVNARRMRHTGGTNDMLSYNLFRDPGRSAIWGFSDGVNTVSQPVEIDNKDPITLVFTIYGRIPPNQDGMVGNYTDTVQVTVTP